MNYNFDESGNWAEPGREQKKLVIGGILLKNNHIIIQLEQEMKLLKANIGLKTFHAADVTKEQLEQSYRLIYNFLYIIHINFWIKCPNDWFVSRYICASIILDIHQNNQSSVCFVGLFYY